MARQKELTCTLAPSRRQPASNLLELGAGNAVTEVNVYQDIAFDPIAVAFDERPDTGAAGCIVASSG